jgi:hypothetical protein
MSHSVETVLKLVNDTIKEMGLSWEVTSLEFRQDYWDYRVILNNTHRCELRQKIIDVWFEKHDEDMKREIEFHLAHPVELEEWEKEELPESNSGGEGKKDISVDNSADYDF